MNGATCDDCLPAVKAIKAQLAIKNQQIAGLIIELEQVRAITCHAIRLKNKV
jgi:hypothetical protein